MPSLRPVTSLKNLCSSRITDHLLDVFLSWYTAQKGEDAVDSTSTIERDLDVYNLTNEFALDHCYKCDHCDDFHVHGKGNLHKNNWLIQVMYDGIIDRCGKTPDCKFCNFAEGDKSGLIPIPIQSQTETATTVLLANQMKQYITSHIPMSVMQDILSSVLDHIADRVQMPRPTETNRCYDEDLDFVNSLGFLLRTSVRSLLFRNVNALDFSSVSHLVLKWRVLCERMNMENDRNIDSPEFNMFGYALDFTLPELRTLKYLKVPHCVDENLVRKVAFLCPNLETLILRCSQDCPSHEKLVPIILDIDILRGNRHYITLDNTEIHLRGCKDLVTLQLPDYYDYNSNHLVHALVFDLPKLRSFIGAPMMEMTRFIDITRKCLVGPTKLTSFHHESSRPGNVFREDLSNIKVDKNDNSKDPIQLSEIFPEVKEVWLDRCSENTLEVVLEQFPNTAKLTLLWSPEGNLPLKYLKNLTSLDMIVQSRDSVFLRELSQSCPNLKELTMRVRILPYVDNASQTKCLFPCLHTLKIHDVSQLEDWSFLSILSVCPSLLYFELAVVYNNLIDAYNDFEQLEVGTFQRALPYLTKLEKFVYKVGCVYTHELREEYTLDDKYANDTLTMDSLRALIDNCPDLKCVGQVETWNVTLEELTAFKHEVKESNWDLEIV